MLARRFCREGLADAGGPKEVNDESVSFAFDEVVEPDFAVVGLDEGLEEVLSVGWEDEVGECVGVPVYVSNFVDVELHWKGTRECQVLLLEEGTYTRVYHSS